MNSGAKAAADEAHGISRGALELAQLSRLRSLLTTVGGSNSFYRPRLQAAGLGAGLKSLSEFTGRCPFTTKEELVRDQAAHPPYGTNLTFPPDAYTRCHGTSGTSGRPLRWLDTPASWTWMLGNWARVYAAAGVNRADRVFFAFSFGPFLGFWTAFEAALGIGCLCLPGGGLSSRLRLRAILEQQVTVLCCTPTYALHLAEVAAREALDLGTARVRGLIVAGEAGGSVPATRRRISEAWHGAAVWDHHGMTEVGPVSYGCPARPGVLHVIEESYLAELVAASDGGAVVAGAAGELVLTTLGRDGSPLLRYRTGDLVRAAGPPGERCACGTFELGLEGGILGRTDEMVVIRGVNVYPTAIEELVRALGGVAEYRMRVRQAGALAELVLEIEPEGTVADPGRLAAIIEEDLHTALALRIPVRVAAPGTLPRSELKANRWVRE